jgi:hypothetical protein
MSPCWSWQLLHIFAAIYWFWEGGCCQFSIFFLYLWLSLFHYVMSGFSLYLLLGVYYISWICKFLSLTKFGNNLMIMFTGSPFLLDSNVTYLRSSHFVPHVAGAWTIFFILFPFFFRWIVLLVCLQVCSVIFILLGAC